ncbi:MAG: thiol:disulfide interchange protein DsbA/DsbL [Betaproteobacteria bacterium]|nr:thiol:disulfide interchange protein DsbA/DsbL [Betaproteobacteria bacterium]
MRKNLFMLMATALLSLFISTSPAQAAAIQNKDFTVLGVPIETDSGSKIEVDEFFWYGCPHCFNLEPGLNSWIKTVPKDVAIRRIPAVLNNSWAVQAKVWYALSALGLANKYHDDFFNAIHLDGLDARSEVSIFNWAGKMGINQQAFANAYNSFGVQSQVAHAVQLTKEAQITGVPTFVVDGQYVTSESMTGGEVALFQTLNALIAKARQAHAHH